MKKTLTLAVVALLLASTALAQPVKIHLFTAPDDGGFVTKESKTRQDILEKVAAKMRKEGRVKKVLELADDAPVTIEILSVDRKGTGASETHTSGFGVALKDKSLTDTSLINETTVRAILKCGDYQKELVSKHVDGMGGDDAILFKELVLAFVKDNAEKLR